MGFSPHRDPVHAFIGFTRFAVGEGYCVLIFDGGDYVMHDDLVANLTNNGVDVAAFWKAYELAV